MKMSSQHTAAPYYFVPGPSRWPLLAGMSLLMTMIGASAWVNDAAWGPYLNIAGIVCIIAVMYFCAFFGALFYARTITMPWLGDLDHKILWPDFAAHWGNLGPAGTVEEFKTMSPFPIPTINTALLLTSGVTLTIAHHALRAGHRAQTAIFLFITILLGATFMGFQASEYMEAYSHMNLKLTSGIYGSTFFMLTGFHGFHVTMGAIMLSVVLYRVLKGHFTPEHHFAFEGAAWYWHFVDVVWLGLYVVVYWL